MGSCLRREKASFEKKCTRDLGQCCLPVQDVHIEARVESFAWTTSTERPTAAQQLTQDTGSDKVVFFSVGWSWSSKEKAMQYHLGYQSIGVTYLRILRQRALFLATDQLRRINDWGHALPANKTTRNMSSSDVPWLSTWFVYVPRQLHLSTQLCFLWSIVHYYPSSHSSVPKSTFVQDLPVAGDQSQHQRVPFARVDTIPWCRTLTPKHQFVEYSLSGCI